MTDVSAKGGMVTGFIKAFWAMVLGVLMALAVPGVAVAQEAVPVELVDPATIKPEVERAKSAVRRGEVAWGKDDYATAIKEYQSACDAKWMEGCFQLGMAYQFAKGEYQDFVAAFKYHGIACEGGNAFACTNLGKAFQVGAGNIPQDKVKARVLFEKACAGSDGTGCANVGDMMLPDEDTNTNDPVYAKAYPLYVQGCDLKSGYACVRKAHSLATGFGVNEDLKAAFTAYVQSCDQSHGTGCEGVGDLYRDGLGVAKSEIKARKYYELACDYESGDACNDLGALYEYGSGGAKDLTKATALYLQGCKLDSSRACLNAGINHLEGLGVAKDAMKAATFYDKACGIGEAGACFDLGSYYFDDETLPPDTDRADALYQKACALNNADGCAARALTYLAINQEKLPDPSLMTEARRWIAKSQAIEEGNKVAKYASEALAEIEKEIAESANKKSLTEKIFGRSK